MNFQKQVPSGQDRVQQVEAFIGNRSFPCVGAKSALNKKRLHVSHFEALGDSPTTKKLWDDLQTYSDAYPDPGQVPVSFVATFAACELDEVAFEKRMWAQLQSLHELDRSRGFQWDRQVSDDPTRPEFSFSVGGRAFFVVGLHPGASRAARRTPFPCLVFNFHDQFEELKASGKYSTLQDAIRDRDTALQGSVNPMLSRFGDASEAMQYSGRAVPASWKCPFHTHGALHA